MTQALPKTRILSYEYDTDTMSSYELGRSNQHGQNLETELEFHHLREALNIWNLLNMQREITEYDAYVPLAPIVWRYSFSNASGTRRKPPSSR